MTLSMEVEPFRVTLPESSSVSGASLSGASVFSDGVSVSGAGSSPQPASRPTQRTRARITARVFFIFSLSP